MRHVLGRLCRTGRDVNVVCCRQIAGILLVFAIAATAMACGSAARGQQKPQPSPTRSSVTSLGVLPGGPAQIPIEVRAAVRKAAYLPGESIEFEFTIVNKSGGAITIRPFAPEIDILDRGSGKSVRSFPSGTSEIILAPGQSRSRTFSWDQTDEAREQVRPGYYLVSIKKIYVGAGYIGGMTSDNSRGVDRIFIQNPQGSLERSVAVGQTVEVSGVRVVLDRVDFTRLGTNVYVRAIPPGYDFPGGVRRPAMPPMSIMPFEPDAQYQIDGGPLLEAGSGGFNPAVRDVEISWDINPSPANATSFVFTVTSLGRWDGPWRFVIDLAAH